MQKFELVLKNSGFFLAVIFFILNSFCPYPDEWLSDHSSYYERNVPDTFIKSLDIFSNENWYSL